MEEQLVSFETAKLLKEKGFDIKCLWWYDLSTNKLSCFGNSYRYQQRQLEKEINTPTQALAQKWLREVHNISVESRCFQEYEKNSFRYSLVFLWGSVYKDKEGNKIGQIINRIDYDSYEHALEAGLIESLNLITE